VVGSRFVESTRVLTVEQIEAGGWRPPAGMPPYTDYPPPPYLYMRGGFSFSRTSGLLIRWGCGFMLRPIYAPRNTDGYSNSDPFRKKKKKNRGDIII